MGGRSSMTDTQRRIELGALLRKSKKLKASLTQRIMLRKWLNKILNSFHIPTEKYRKLV